MYSENEPLHSLENDLHRLKMYHVALFFNYSLRLWEKNAAVFESQLLAFLYYLDKFITQYPDCKDTDFLDLKKRRQELRILHSKEGKGQLVLGRNLEEVIEIHAVLLLGNEN